MLDRAKGLVLRLRQVGIFHNDDLLVAFGGGKGVALNV
jgi:hypothetical protein